MNSQNKRRESGTKIVLIGLFFVILGAFIYFTGVNRILETVSGLGWLDLALLGLATFRLGHLVAYDRVMEPFRSAVARTVPDATGAGDTVEPHGEGVQQALGQLVTCPICAGTWISMLLVLGLVLFPAVMRLFLWMTAAIGLAEILHAWAEMLCWTGQKNRVLSGRKTNQADED